MFFYISFLRPPPLQAPPYGTIPITPQISNDLRTEPFGGSQDLYFSWSQAQPYASISNSTTNITTTTKPLKLTTWRQITAYKEIPVPIPPGVREGQSWCLILTATAQSHGRSRPDTIDLGSEEIGKLLPFSVISMPVIFSARGAKNAAKQEKVERMYLLPFTEAGNGDLEPSGNNAAAVASLRFTEQTSFDLDKKIWDSGIGLSSWLVDFKENRGSQMLHDNLSLQYLYEALFSKEPRNILELGAGIGIVSIVLGVLRSGLNAQSTEGRIQDRILTTDVSSAIPLLEHNISANVHFCPLTTPKASVLDWDDDVLPEEVQDLGNLNAVVMADVSYNTSSFPSLARTLSHLVRLGPQPPIILLGYKERDVAERTWWEIAEQAGIDFEKIGERVGAGGAPVEIWVGYAHV